MSEDSSLRRYRMKIAYDGTDFCGWQTQPNGVTIQQTLQEAIQILTKEFCQPLASGRTDSGVHAKGQIAHIDLTKPIQNPDKFQRSLNGLLPRSIRILGFEPCTTKFHARYSVLRKTYHYFLHLNPIEDPFSHRYHWWIHEAINISTLEKACRALQGTHNFKAFANENHKGVAAIDSIRTLFRVEPHPTSSGLRLEFEGDGFLYKMVRNCTGLLVEVARGRSSIEDITHILNQESRSMLGYCAPAQGLFLHHVDYSNSEGPSKFLSLV